MNTLEHGNTTKTKTTSAKLIFAGVHRKAKSVREHAHDCVELILVNKGSCTVHAGSHTLHAKSGEIIMMPARQIHDQISKSHIDTVYCGFIAPPAMNCPEPHVTSLPDATFIEQCMQLLASVSLNQIQASAEAAEAVLNAVLEQLRHQHVLHQELAQMPPLLRITLRYIEEHLSEPITLDQNRTLYERVMQISSTIYRCGSNFLEGIRYSLTTNRFKTP